MPRPTAAPTKIWIRILLISRRCAAVRAVAASSRRAIEAMGDASASFSFESSGVAGFESDALGSSGAAADADKGAVADAMCSTKLSRTETCAIRRSGVACPHDDRGLQRLSKHLSRCQGLQDHAAARQSQSSLEMRVALPMSTVRLANAQ